MAGTLYDSRLGGVDSLQGNIALGDVAGDAKPDLGYGDHKPDVLLTESPVYPLLLLNTSH